MKKAFTMIELIFVIVIIGVLAAVAIPKLAATRDDAKIAEMIADTRTALGDLSGYYTSRGSTNWIDVNSTIINATSVVFLDSICDTIDANASKISPNNFYLCEGNQACILLETTDAGTLEISEGSGTGPVCDAAQENLTIQNIMKVHTLGGRKVNR